MASSTNLEERFNKAVKTIQNLPANGIIQPSNLTKLIFYGLYKQVTLGPCKESRPSMFNYVARAKWEAWDRCRSMTKEEAMLEYIDEIRKIVEKMPQTIEVLEFAQLIGLSNKSIDEQSKTNVAINIDNHNEQPLMNSNNPTETIISTKNDPVSSSSSSSFSMSPSDIDEFYDDPSDFYSINHDEIPSNNTIQEQSIHHHIPHTFNETNVPVRHNPSNEVQYSTSSITSDRENEYYTKETQCAILTALTKLQQDINNILERLNRLETSTSLLQQKQLLTNLELNSSSPWLPLSGFRRSSIAFILFWPFIAFILIRLFIHAKIIIRFRRQHH